MRNTFSSLLCPKKSGLAPVISRKSEHRAVSSLSSHTPKCRTSRSKAGASFPHCHTPWLMGPRASLPHQHTPPGHAIFSAHRPLRSESGGHPPLPLPGASACGRSRLSAHWGPTAAGRPCCLSELWSAEQTSPNLKQAEEHKGKVSYTPTEHRHPHLETPQPQGNIQCPLELP